MFRLCLFIYGDFDINSNLIVISAKQQTEKEGKCERVLMANICLCFPCPPWLYIPGMTLESSWWNRAPWSMVTNIVYVFTTDSRRFVRLHWLPVGFMFHWAQTKNILHQLKSPIKVHSKGNELESEEMKIWGWGEIFLIWCWWNNPDSPAAEIVQCNCKHLTNWRFIQCKFSLQRLFFFFFLRCSIC